MAFYEMLPGAGMPPGLQAGMDSVLNKKFGTSTTYPAEDWPDTVNLMGPLPEKTASGAIVTFPDGADAVPLKKCEITLPASLDGYSSVDVVNTGKNLFNVADYSQIYTDRDGIDSYNYRYMIIRLKPNTTYTVSHNSGEAKSTPIVLINSVLPVSRSNYLDLRTASGSKTYTTGDDGYLYIGSVNSYDNVAYARLQECNIQIEAGNAATTYEPYTAPTTHTASLGRTIYGGSADVANGTGNNGYKKITLSSNLNGLTMAQIGTTGVYRVRFNLSDAKGAANTSVFSGLCDYYTPASANQTYAQTEGIAINTSGQCFIYDSRFNASTSLNDFKTWIDSNPVNLVYELATATDFTFDGQEVPTRLGYNAFWSDEGDTEVTYRADINLALGGN